jgi:sugar phosphate isomerase/epimerase
MELSLKDRIGIDLNRRIALEPGIDWAIRHGLRYCNICLDPEPELLDPANPRLKRVRERISDSGLTLGLHTLSAMNVAEMSPFLSEAADTYLDAYIKAAKAIGASWVIMHGGYHFTADKQDRMDAAVRRLERASKVAEDEGMTILLENMNPEPAGAEVKYLVHDIEEARYYFDRLTSPSLRWAFTANHAHMLPYGIKGFIDSMDVGRLGEVRIADNRGVIEEHLRPGEGSMDFPALFALLEGRGYCGHYMQDYTTIEDMLAGRDRIVELVEAETSSTAAPHP